MINFKIKTKLELLKKEVEYLRLNGSTKEFLRVQKALYDYVLSNFTK